MSTIPDKTAEGFQQHFVEHLIDAARLSTKVENLEVEVGDVKNRTLTELTGLSVKLDALTVAIQAVPERISACRVEVRNEVERDFPNRRDSLEMEHRIEKKVEEGDRDLPKQISELSIKFTGLETKVDKMWLKIAGAVSIIGLIVVIIGLLLDRWAALSAVARALPI